MALENCIHQKVCKHFQEDEVAECLVKTICRHFAKDYSNSDDDSTDIFPEVKRRKKEPKDTDLQAQFKKARIYLALHEADLDENQKAAVAAQKGKFFSKLTKEQINQLIEIAAYIERARTK